MKRKKYGEDTVVIRVPVSQKQAVLKFIEQFEVIGNLKNLDDSNPLHDAYMQGYIDCFDLWQEFQVVLPLVLSGNEAFVPLALDVMRGNIPESARLISMNQLTDVLLKSHRKLSKIDSQLELLQKMLDDSFSKAGVKSQKFSSILEKTKLLNHSELSK